MRTSETRFTGNRYPVSVRRTLRCDCLGDCELLAATGEGSHNRESRFTLVLIFSLFIYLLLLSALKGFPGIQYDFGMILTTYSDLSKTTSPESTAPTKISVKDNFLKLMNKGLQFLS